MRTKLNPIADTKMILLRSLPFKLIGLPIRPDEPALTPSRIDPSQRRPAVGHRLCARCACSYGNFQVLMSLFGCFNLGIPDPHLRLPENSHGAQGFERFPVSGPGRVETHKVVVPPFAFERDIRNLIRIGGRRL